MGKQIVIRCIIILAILSPSGIRAETQLGTEQQFHDLFITAGYSTAFGAALGAAFLGLMDDPAGNLRFIAIGASLGFIGGSLLGTYMIFSPVIITGGEQDPLGKDSVFSEIQGPAIKISPVLGQDSRLLGMHASFKLLSF